MNSHTVLRGLFLAGILLPALPSLSQSSAPPPPSTPQPPPPALNGILFAASANSHEKDESGKPVLPHIEPVARVVNGKILDCPTVKGDGSPTPAFVARLNALYKPGNTLPLWSGGAPVATMETASSCMVLDVSQLMGCVRYRDLPKAIDTPNFRGTAWTGTQPDPIHQPLRVPATPEEKRTFLVAAAATYEGNGVRATPAQIHLKALQHIRLSDTIEALAGSMRIQHPTSKPGTYQSVWMFLVIVLPTAERPSSQPLLAHLYKNRAYLEFDQRAPKPGQEIPEESTADEEFLVDSFPLFPGEPDLIITTHQFYEDTGYSVYRWQNGTYRVANTGCGWGA